MDDERVARSRLDPFCAQKAFDLVEVFLSLQRGTGLQSYEVIGVGFSGGPSLETVHDENPAWLGACRRQTG